MRLTKYSQSCVRVETAESRLVIDPGEYSEPESLDGADVVLITHGHPDHLDQGKLVDALARNSALEVYTNSAVAERLTGVPELRTSVRSIDPGQRFVAGGVSIRAFGGSHAVIHPDLPRLMNLGFLLRCDGGTVYHPGDSFDPPDDDQVDTLLVPVAGPWMKISEAVQFVREIGPRRALGIHDAVLSQLGRDFVTGNMLRLCSCEYQTLRPGSSV